MREIWITGLGVVSPLGRGVGATRAALRAGHCGIHRIQQFSAAEFPVPVAGEVASEVDATEIPAGPGRAAALAQMALDEALREAGLAGATLADPRRALCWALGKPSVDLEQLRDWMAEGEAPQAALLGARLAAERRRAHADPEGLLRSLARRAGAGGERFACYTACASGNDVLGLGKRLIERGEASVVVVGGADAQVDPLSLLEFELLSALAHPVAGDPPERACRPFDRRRTGFVIGEGAAVLILEEGEHACRRGVQAHARLAGYGGSLDAFGITKCHPDGRGAALAMRRALDDAGIPAAAIGYINAHGTGTVLNDRAEAAAIHAVWGPDARSVPVSSTKAMTGHLIAAASAVEAVLTILAMEDGFIPPSLNYEEFDPECDLAIVAGDARLERFGWAISNGFGFGGQNACVVLGAIGSAARG